MKLAVTPNKAAAVSSVAQATKEEPEKARKSAVTAADRSAARAAMKLAVTPNKAAAVSSVEQAAKEELEKAQKSAVMAADRSAARAAMKMAVTPNKAAAVSSVEPAEKEEDKPKPAAEGNRIIRLPDWYIKRLQEHGARRPKPLHEGFLDHNPKLREMVLARKEAASAFVDVEKDILMQVRDKGYAEVMLEYDDDGVVDFAIIPEA